MKVLNISLLRHMGDEKQQPVILCHTFDVSDFGYFMRGRCGPCVLLPQWLPTGPELTLPCYKVCGKC